MIEERKIEYLKPVNIVDSSKNIVNKEALFDNDEHQIDFIHDNYMQVNGRGFIVLDFGKELCGGIRILHNYFPHQRRDLKIRIRFGESLSECYQNKSKRNNVNNFQSIKDATLPLPTLTDFSFGDTGFRFVRIDFLTNIKYRFVNIYAKSFTRDYEEKGSFWCDDELVNKIFNTSIYTIKLCMQNEIWDGVKRDRLAWVGDMEPELKAIQYIYGDIDLIKSSLAHSEQHYKLPSWFGKIPSYNAWYIEILYNYFMMTGNRQFVIDRLEYINQIINQFDDCIKDNGVVDFKLSNIDFRGYFIDWPTFKSKNSQSGYSYLLLYIFKDIKEMYKKLKVSNDIVDKIINKLNNFVDHEFTEKQFNCFKVLSTNNNSKELYNSLVKDNSSGMSCFMSYYILSAVASYNSSSALDMMKEYFGSMIDLGATTFFEEHDINWTKNTAPITRLAKRNESDYHRDFGIECYRGYRESLCHGWSSSCIQFLIEKIVGLKVLEPGFSKIEIKPNLGYLKHIKVSVPTPKGILNIELVDNKIITNDIGIEIIK